MQNRGPGGPMNIQDMGNRAARRKGSNPKFGGSNADDHVYELIGSSGLWIYLAHNQRLKGIEELKRQVEARGCLIGWAEDAPVIPGKSYQTLKIAVASGGVLPEDLIKRAHRWAHRHNFLHSFYKPGYNGLLGVL